MNIQQNPPASDLVEFDGARAWILVITMPDGSGWAVPVEVIAKNRAAYYADEFDGNIEQSLNEDTLPLFRSDSFEIKDWASNNMDWSDVEKHAWKISDVPEPDFQEGWLNGDKEVLLLKNAEDGGIDVSSA